VLVSSGLIAGGAIVGTLIAFLSMSSTIPKALDFSKAMGAAADSDLVAFVLFLGLCGVLYAVANEFLLKGGEEKKA
jgi:hypothetical protein